MELFQLKNNGMLDKEYKERHEESLAKGQHPSRPIREKIFENSLKKINERCNVDMQKLETQRRA